MGRLWGKDDGLNVIPVWGQANVVLAMDQVTLALVVSNAVHAAEVPVAPLVVAQAFVNVFNEVNAVASYAIAEAAASPLTRYIKEDFMKRNNLSFALCVCASLALILSSCASMSGRKSSALIDAVKANDIARVRELIAGGENLDFQDSENGATALMYAVEGDNVEIVRLLIEAGANIDICDNDGDPALNWAVLAGSNEIVKLFLDMKVNPNIQNNFGATPLLCAALGESTGIVRLLIEASANPNIQDEDGWTALMFAVLAENTEIVRLLLAAGARTDIWEYEYGDTALDVAEFVGNAEIIRMLNAAR